MSQPINTQATQIQLMMMYKSMLYNGHQLPHFDEVHFREYSQGGEDGILLFIFSLIGTTNKKALEICAERGVQCNSTNLIINHGWEGFLFDGSEENVKEGLKFFRSVQDTKFWPPTFRNAWITRENINDLVSSCNLEGEIDLLSLDIDGNDYWIFEALDVVQPRVFIAEYQMSWGPDAAITQRYDADFNIETYRQENPNVRYNGVSLRALVNLADKKGLRLVGCERKCYNAVFIRKGLAEDIFPTIDPAECFGHSMARFMVNWKPEHVSTDDPFWVEV
ncbi:MAG: hypothetical protein Hals2KO_23030 [Halioglobus sp.]